MSQIPYDIAPVIFKYFTLDKNFWNSILQGKLWFSDPLSFNDPYDCNLSLYFENDNDLIREHYTEINNHFRQIGNDFLSEEKLQNKINEFIQNPVILKNNADVYTKSYINNVGVCCFSKREDIFLMWSHYADKHKGICLKFKTDIDKSFFHQLYFEVEYPRHFPQFNYLRNTGNILKGYRTGLSQHLLATKSPDWGYECVSR